MGRKKKYTKNRHIGSKLIAVCIRLSALWTMGILLFIIGYILWRGARFLTPSLFSPVYTSENLSLLPALINTVFMTVTGLVFAVPVGIGAAIFLVEYAGKDNRIVPVLRMATETLTGIPSIVFGLFGMLFFVNALHMGFSILAGACTLAIMVLPVIIRTTEEALLAVPMSYREASYGLGARKLRTIFRIVLPSAMPGILSGVILSVGRMVGETAALIYTSSTVAQLAGGLFSPGRTLALHMYVLSSEGLHMDQAFATATILLVVVLVMNRISGHMAKGITKGGDKS